MGNPHKFTREQIIEAIDNSDYTYSSVADYLALYVSRNGKCDDMTAKAYITKYNLDAYLHTKTTEVTKDALATIRKAIKKGDVKSSKWWLERVLRSQFGNEVTVHNENPDPLNINLNGAMMSAEELAKASNIEIGGSDE